MRYENIKSGKFRRRINRFVAEIEIENKLEKCHVKNTGRCEELFVDGAEIYVQDHRENMGKRNLKFSLTSINKCGNIINVDSQIPNHVVDEGLRNGSITLPDMGKLTLIRRESKYSDSRFDFYVEDDCGNRAYIEVKGVTLEIGDIAYFPDAPTQRGLKHLGGLCLALEEGYKSFVIFLIQMTGPKEFRPNAEKQPEFAEKLAEAEGCGVHVLAYDSIVTENSITVGKPLKINF